MEFPHTMSDSLYWAAVTQAAYSMLLKDKTAGKVRRSQLTAPLSHLCLLTPPLFYLLTLLFLHLLLFLLLPSAAEAVQATEAGTGEGHGLPDAPHPRKPAEGEGRREGGKRGRTRGEALQHFYFIWQSAKTSHCSGGVSPKKSFEHTWLSGIKEEETAVHSFMHIEPKWVFWLGLLTEVHDLAKSDSLTVCLNDLP